MNKPNFTPGPWLTGDKTKNNYSSCRIFAKKNNFLVCVAATDQELSYAQGEHDANLIAAAPDMYAALESFLLGYKQLSSTSRAHVGGLSKAFNDAVQALAKARGENEPNKPNI